MKTIWLRSEGMQHVDDWHGCVGGVIRVGNKVNQKRTSKLPESLGFRELTSSVHTSRTMMFAELSLVMDQVEKSSKLDEYINAMVDQNILGKPTQTTRKRSAQRLVELYCLDQDHAVFRLLRYFWSADASARPMLAYLTATARDPLLRETTPFVLAVPLNSVLNVSEIVNHLQESYPARFKPTTLLSTAQNLASSWTQAGYLTGRTNKKRTRSIVTPVVVTYALLLSYLCGARGKMLLDTIWIRMLDRSFSEIVTFATDASTQGWMSYKAAGSVVEITFPGLLTPQDERASHEQN